LKETISKTLLIIKLTLFFMLMKK